VAHTVLLADDSVTIQRLVALTFASEDGFDVVVTADGHQAIAALAHTTPDVVLADVGMPGLDGYEVARHIRRTPALAHVPVLLLTGAFEPVDADRAREAGTDGVLAKPFEPQAMIDRVKELIAKRAGAVAAPPAPRPEEAARLDDYFASLDEAIQTRVAAAPPAAPETAMDGGAEPEPAPAPAAHDDNDGPLLAGAFSALLAAEQTGAAPDAFADWLPQAAAPAAPAAPAITDELIEQIVERVLARLPDRVVKDAVREAASAITSSTAERLVLEEIARIKSHIK